jgi:Predicted aspartyl protease
VRGFIVSVVVMLAVDPAWASGRTTVPVPLAIDNRGGIVVDVRVNGLGPFRFILDTGAARSIVSDDLARELRAPVVAKSEVVTSAGTDMRLVVRLGSLALASSRVDGLLAPVIPGDRLLQLGPRVRGLLGQDFLSAFNYTLDYRRARLTWDEPLGCAGPNVVPMVPAEGRFVMALRSESGTPLRLVPDSGAEVAVLFGGARDSPSLSRVRVGSFTLRDLRPVVVERVDEHADGLLPLHGFSSVSFAAGGGCVVIRR